MMSNFSGTTSLTPPVMHGFEWVNEPAKLISSREARAIEGHIWAQHQKAALEALILKFSGHRDGKVRRTKAGQVIVFI